jgi:hypothetical protein
MVLSPRSTARSSTPLGDDDQPKLVGRRVRFETCLPDPSSCPTPVVPEQRGTGMRKPPSLMSSKVPARSTQTPVRDKCCCSRRSDPPGVDFPSPSEQREEIIDAGSSIRVSLLPARRFFPFAGATIIRHQLNRKILPEHPPPPVRLTLLPRGADTGDIMSREALAHRPVEALLSMVGADGGGRDLERVDSRRQPQECRVQGQAVEHAEVPIIERRILGLVINNTFKAEGRDRSADARDVTAFELHLHWKAWFSISFLNET